MNTPEHPAQFGLYSSIPNAVISKLCAEKPPSSVWATMLLLCRMANEHGNCWPSISHISESIGRSERVVFRSIEWLEQHGFIQKTARLLDDGRQTSSLYVLSWTLSYPVSDQGGGCQKRQGEGDENVRGRVTKTSPKELSYEETPFKNNPLPPFRGNSSSHRETKPSVDAKAKQSVKGNTPAPSLPPNLSPEVWADWVRHRAEKKSKLTPIAIQRQLKMLAEQPDPNAVVERSIMQGWTGLFPLKDSDAPRRNEAPEPTYLTPEYYAR